MTYSVTEKCLDTLVTVTVKVTVTITDLCVCQSRLRHHSKKSCRSLTTAREILSMDWFCSCCYPETCYMHFLLPPKFKTSHTWKQGTENTVLVMLLAVMIHMLSDAYMQKCACSRTYMTPNMTFLFTPMQVPDKTLIQSLEADVKQADTKATELGNLIYIYIYIYIYMSVASRDIYLCKTCTLTVCGEKYMAFRKTKLSVRIVIMQLFQCACVHVSFFFGVSTSILVCEDFPYSVLYAFYAFNAPGVLFSVIGGPWALPKDVYNACACAMKRQREREDMQHMCRSAERQFGKTYFCIQVFRKYWSCNCINLNGWYWCMGAYIYTSKYAYTFIHAYMRTCTGKRACTHAHTGQQQKFCSLYHMKNPHHHMKNTSTIKKLTPTVGFNRFFYMS
jgi:hypothetical protein